MTSRHVFFTIPLVFLFACSSGTLRVRQTRPLTEHTAFLLAPDPNLSEEEWDKKALELALTGGVAMVKTICTEDQKTYACNFLASTCENGNKEDCKTPAELGYQDERYKYYRLACNFEDAESCKMVQSMVPENNRAPASDAISAELILNNWSNGAIDRYIASTGGPPTRITSMGEGRTLYEYIDKRGDSTMANILEPSQCTIQLFVEPGLIPCLKLRRKTGVLQNSGVSVETLV